MKEGKPSYTAEAVACYRAVESLEPEHSRVCYDPFAVYFLRRSYRLLCKLPVVARIVFRLFAERDYSGDVAQSLARTRFIDDYVEDAIKRGFEQLVILGAGYDSRAYRLDVLKGIKVFEVDHPATQDAKTKTLKSILGSLPSHVTYVPTDFDLDVLAPKLTESGYRTGIKTLFIWEGVTYFLSREAVDATLGFVRENSPPGSLIIFDYIFKSVVDGVFPSAEARRLRAVLEKLGEPYKFGIEEGCVTYFLEARGFSKVKEISPSSLTDTYLKTQVERRKVAPFLPLVCAEV